MSRTSFIQVKYSSENVPVQKIISMFLEQGWNLNDHGAITYLPPKSDDVSDWQRADLEQKDLILELIAQKEKHGETTGIVIMWQDSQIGSDVLFRQDKTIVFGLSINRKVNSHAHDFTDVGWYLNKIIPLLSLHGIDIVSVSWEEYV